MNINVSGNYTLELAPEAFVMNTANLYLQCNTSSAPVVITLPRITTLAGVTTTWGFKIFVNDMNNNASVNNITLIPHPADKINGTLATPLVLNTNGVTGHLQVTGTNSWEFNIGSSSSGTPSTDMWIYVGRVAYTAWQPNATTTGTIPIANIPAGFVVSETAMELITAYSGGTIDDCELTLRTSPPTVGAGSLGSMVLFNPPPNTRRNSASSTFDRNSAYTIDATLQVFDASHTINQLTQGEVDIWYKIEKLPPVV